METFCPVTGCKVVSRPEWINRKVSDTLTVNFWVVGDSIIYSFPEGRADLEGVKNCIALKMEVLKHVSDGNKPYVHIQDYAALNGSTHAARSYFINNANEDKRLLSIIFCNLSLPLSIAVKIGIRFNTANKIIHITGHYSDAIKRAIRLIDPQGLTPDETDLNIKEWFDNFDRSLSPIELISDDDLNIETPNFSSRGVIINSHILYSISAGKLEDKDLRLISRRHELCQKLIPEGSRIEYIVLDSSKLSGGSHLARINYLKFMRDWHKKHPVRMYIIQGANSFMRTAIQLARPLMPFRIKTVTDIKKAFLLIRADKYGFLPQKHEINESEKYTGVTNKDINKLLALIGSINWEQDGIDNSYDVGVEHPFYFLHQSIILIKEELDDLFKERKRAKEKIRKLNETLEQRVTECTDELN